MIPNQSNTNYYNNKDSSYFQKVNKLKNYFWIIQDLLDELIINQDSSVITAAQISGMPKSQVIRTLDEVYISRQKSNAKLSEQIEKQITQKKIIENAILKIDDPQLRYVLKNKYLYFKTLEEIANNLNKSYKQINRWHNNAINKLDLADLNY